MNKTPNLLCRALLALLLAAIGTSAVAKSPEMVWVGEGVPTAPIIVPLEDPTKEVHKAAKDLAGYVERMSGRRPEIIQGTPNPLPERAVWVGYQPVLKTLFPYVNFDFQHPEEILMVANSQYLVIAGRDRESFVIPKPVVYSATPVGEFGTANALSTFIHDRLGVRWLWPGELGTDIPHRDRIAFEPFSFRYHPPIRSRRFRLEGRYARADQGQDVAAVNYFWENAHRLNRRSSHTLPRDHAYNDWSDRYREKHPEYFALLPNGERSQGRDAKLCLPNPAVEKQWLDNQVEVLRDNPRMESLGANQNDGGGWCVCEACLAMDHPNAPGGVNTERHVKYWNNLIRGLRERVPDKKLFLDVCAYAAYKSAPIETRLEDDIAVSYVGHYPFCSNAEWLRSWDDMRRWKAAGAKFIGYRPNYAWYDGGFWGMPSVAMEKTHALFKALAEGNCHVFEIDSVFQFSATQGPQNYLLARLVYDPSADGRAILDDFYKRGFGPAANDVRAYYEIMEKSHAELVENPAWRVSSSARFKHLELLRRVHTPERLATARKALELARVCAEGKGGDPVYVKRVAFVRAGLEFVALNMQAAAFMERVRRSNGGDREAVEKATEICAERDKLLAEAPPFAIDVPYFQNRIVSSNSTNSRRMGDYLGPPNQKFIDAEPSKASRKLAVVENWREDFHDDFNRATLGDNWQVVSGDWKIQDGKLVSIGDRTGNVVLLKRPMAALQRIEFVAASVPSGWEQDPQAKAGEASDLGAILHASAEKPLDGYSLLFGARFNSANAVSRTRDMVFTDVAETRVKIEPGRFYTIAAEFDGRHVRMTVDGKKILEYEERVPLFGSSHDRIGIYSYTPIQVKSVKVFSAEARETEYFDDPDTR